MQMHRTRRGRLCCSVSATGAGSVICSVRRDRTPFSFSRSQSPMFRHRYPPARYVCYPLYRRLRRRWRWPCVAAYFVVWVVSGLLHSLVFLVFGQPIIAVGFTAVFTGLGATGVGAIILKKRHRRLRGTQLPRPRSVPPIAEPQHAADGSQPFRSVPIREPPAAGSHR
jgi:hypothetical protein